MSSLTEIEAAHEGELAVYHDELLVVSPKENHISRGSVHRLDGLSRCLGQVEDREVLEVFAKLCLDVVPGWYVVGMSEDADIGM